MTKLSTFKKLTMVVDLLQGTITLDQITPEQNEQMVSYFRENAIRIGKSKDTKKAEPKAPSKPKAKKPVQKVDYTEIKNDIMEYLQANPNLLTGSSDLCRNIEKFRENGYKPQKLTRPIIQLQEEGKIKVVETKPKKLFQLA